MRRWIFSGALLVFAALPSVFAFGGEMLPDSLAAVAEKRLDRRKHRGYEGWERLTPTHAKLQFAGGIGLLSGGIGWDYGRRCRWETDFLLGYVPRFDSRSAHATFTLKQNYIPWSIACCDRFAVEPLTCALYMSVITGQEFWTRVPDRYPSRTYYPMPTKLRTYFSMGQRFVWSFVGKRKVRSLAAYYEFCTCDYYLVAVLGNRSLGLTDIFSLSFGLKLQLF